MKTLVHSDRDQYAVLSKTIKAFRKNLSLSQQELAKLSGVSQGQLSRIERGEHIPSIESLDMIAKALKIPISLITYIAFDRSRHQDELSRKLFESHDLLLNLFLYIRNLELKEGVIGSSDKKASVKKRQLKNKESIINNSMELKKMRDLGMKAISGDFIEDYLSSFEKNN